MVVDVVGTLDECRFTYDGMHVSKEIAVNSTRKRVGIMIWNKQKKKLKLKVYRIGNRFASVSLQNWTLNLKQSLVKCIWQRQMR